MTFIPADILSEDISYIKEYEDTHTASSPIGYHSQTGVYYVAVASFTPLIGGSSGEYELIFTINTVNEEAGQIQVHYCGTETAFIPKAYRAQALSQIISLAMHLTGLVSPELIVMTQHTGNVPSKALRKYEAICRALSLSGYDGRKGNKYNGLNIWMIKK
jgi:hypothetical protein